jgi:hypothetical protein
MRPGQKNRSRGRNGGGMPHHNRGGGGPRPPHRSQTFDSNGPSVKIRGNAYQVFERYIAMAREAQSSGDRVAAENLYQHAEHYFRIMNAQNEGQQHGQPRPTTPADLEMSGGGDQGDGQGDGRQSDGRPRDEDGQGQAHVQVHQPQPQPAPSSDEQPPYGDRDEQPGGYRDEQPPYGQPPYEPPRSY